MSVTPLSTRPPGPAGPSRSQPTPRRRASIVPIRRLNADAATDSDAPLSLSFDVSFTGDHRHRDALELIDSLHRLVDEFGARVSIASGQPAVSAPPALTPVPDLGDSILIHAPTRSVRFAGEVIAFTRVEYDLLLFLAEHRRQVFTRRQLLQSVWGHQHAGERTVDVHIRRLRAKLGDDVVVTVRSIGYRLADETSIQIAHHPLPERNPR